MIDIKKDWIINESKDVVEFIRYMQSICVFHPDDDMLSYLNFDTDEPLFSVDDANYLNSIIEKSFWICGEDVYDICLITMAEKEGYKSPILHNLTKNNETRKDN